MATQTASIGVFQSGAAELSVGYDDATLKLLSVTLRNDGLPFTLTITLSDPQTGQVFFTRARGFGQGSVTQDVSGSNIDMVMLRGSAHLPFTVTLSTS